MRILLALALAGSVIAPCLGQTTAGTSGEAPYQFYVRYRETIQKATSIDQILAFWSDAQAKAFKAAPPDQRMGLDELKKAYAMATLTKVGVASQMAEPDSATLLLEAVTADKKVIKGTARLIKENGTWKLTGPEQWGN